MSAARHTRLRRMRNIALVLAHLAVLGLPSSHKFYRFSNPHRTYARTITGNLIHPVSRSGENSESFRRQLLDRRFSYEHVYCLFSPSFGLPVLAGEGEAAPRCHSHYKKPDSLPRNLRGPPAAGAI